jgi:hypothetical protein
LRSVKDIKFRGIFTGKFNEEIRQFPHKSVVSIDHLSIDILLRNAALEGYICGVSKKFGEWCQKTNKTEDTNTLTLLAFKIIAILHNTLLATFIKLLETVSKGLF